VVYHPSGLAFAFVIEVDGRNEIWISTNLGQKPRLLVHGRLHTQIDAIALGDRGQSLYFAARHDDWTHMHQLLLAEPTDAPTAWQGEGSEAVSDLLPLDPQRAETRLAFTVGTSCTSRRAVVRGVEALPGQRPSRAIGWLDRGQRARLLVGVGGCGRPLDLYAVDSITRRATLLVRNVDAASTRLAESEPPPPLPEQMEEEGSGFA
jgi:hypothetical protein